jgi:hypothetical protein
VRAEGLEPSPREGPGPKPGASAIPPRSRVDIFAHTLHSDFGSVRASAKLHTVRRVPRVGNAIITVVIPLTGIAVSPAGAAVSVTHATRPAFALDAPDPYVVRSGGTYYAYTTGTAWGTTSGF